MFQFFDSGKPSGLLFFPKSQNKIRAGFIYSKKIGRFAAGFIFGVFFIRKSPLITPFSQKFLARFARGLLFIPKNFARGFLFFPIFSKFSRGLLFFQFSIFKKPFGLSGLLLKGGF